MIVFEKTYYEPCQRKSGSIIAAMYASIMGMTNSSDSVLLVEAAAQEQNFVTPGGIAMSGGLVGLSCKRLSQEGEPSGCAVRHHAVSEWNGTQH